MSQVERKRFFVNSIAQGHILMRFAMYWTVYHIVLWHTLFLFRFFQYRFELMMGEPPQTFGELYGSFCVQYYPIVFSAVAMIPLLLWDIVKMTHRIVGPLIRFQRALETLQRGERLNSVKLRDRDLLREYEAAFNTFLGYYNKQLEELHALRAEKQAWQQSQAGDFKSLSEQELLSQVEELSGAVAAATSPIPAP
jgi:methyl-accepting chemotaxis protein